ncbi:S8 family peptidase [Agromyces sp. Marseille-Q5079]|uniref:S8 family peptidase n=1 Tax=Agromyces sp. Marseille-Q5079 TaxID=3439059 RepID=UPI003D9CA22B
MPRSSRTSAQRHRRSIAAAISGLAIGIAGVGAATLPAIAEPIDGGGAPPAASGASPAASAGGTHLVTLITGDRVRVTDLPDGAHTVDVETAVPGAAVQTLEIDGDLHVLPQAALPYLAAGVVDRDLFNVTQLIEYGYDDASVSATPVILEFADGPAAYGAPLPGVEIGASLESVGGAAATADHATAASTWNALTAASGASTFSTEVELGGGIEAIHLDGKVQATLDSSVPWIGAPAAWEAGFTGTGVTVAVLDTGYDDTHPDLAGRVLAEESRSFVPGEADVASDLHGHGTHVASTIAGTGAASGGANRGVADGADLLVGKVLGADGSGQDSWIIEAMQWAGEHADIVSMSLGSSEPSDGTDVMSEALDTISEQTGALFVVAAGNNGAPEAIGAPGAAAKALTVGSVADPTGALSYFSNQGPLAFSGALKPELVGPGEDVTAARSADSPGEGSYVGMSGTSMATPHVAGAAALLKQQHPEYTADQLRAALISTAKDVGLTSYEGGSGVVDLETAIDAPVIASGSGDFGMLSWGEEPEPVVRTIDYANRSADEVVVDLAASFTGAPDGVLALGAEQLTIPAGESRSVDLSVDPSKVETGSQLSGALTASIDGIEVARTALGTIAEQERYDLTVTATGFDGEPVETYAVLYDVANDYYVPIIVSGETTMRLPDGEYAVIAYMTVDHAVDESVTVLVGDPDLVLDADAEVALDARAAKPVTVDVGQDGLEPWFSRLDLRADAFTSSYIDAVTSDGFYAQPMTAPNADSFTFTSRWRLQQPMLGLKAGKERLDLIVQPGSTLHDATFKSGAVDAGNGSAEAFASVKAAGKVAVVTRSAEVSASQRAANALAAGAVALLVVNDADGEFNEWVGSEDYTSSVDLPVAGVSGVQGRRLLESIAAKKVTITGASEPAPDEAFDILRFSDGSVPEDLDYHPKDLARIDTTFHGQTGALVGEFRWDFDPVTQYSVGQMLRTERGLTRTDWVNTDQVEWNEGAMLIDAAWEVRDLKRRYEPGAVAEATFFGPIVRPFVGPGYWAPMREGDYAQVNVPSWADGGSPEHTGAFDVFAPMDDRSQLTEVWVDGELRASVPWQSATVFDLPEGESEFRVLNTAVHDGTYIPSSTKTLTEWTFRSTGTVADYTAQTLPMMQAYYDVEADAEGRVGSGRKAGKPVELGLELSHIEDAIGMAQLTGATLEMRVVGGDWKPVALADVAADEASATPMLNYPVERPFLETYTAKLPVPDAGAWIDLRVTAADAAGNTFSQEIERAFEAAPAKGGHGSGHGGGQPGWPHGGHPGGGHPGWWHGGHA